MASVAPATPDENKPYDRSTEVWQGFRVGAALIVLNPAAIVTWVVIMSSIVPEAKPLQGALCAIGVFIGSFSWFTLVAYLTQKGKNVLGDKAAWIPRIVGVELHPPVGGMGPYEVERLSGGSGRRMSARAAGVCGRRR